jgi:hypothetical protein
MECEQGCRRTSAHCYPRASRSYSISQANTKNQRAWFRHLFEAVGVEHELHFIDASDDFCKRQLKGRSKELPAGTPWTTDAEFDAVTAYFEAPSIEERFNVIRHERA